MACPVYFWARLVYLVAHSLAIPWVCTLAFVAELACQITLVVQILL